jgi:hypothetical protein
MEINTNINTGAAGRVAPSRPTVPAAKVVTDEAVFAQSSALNDAVNSLPASRVEAVERARSLVADVNYPPRETIQKISNLLAMHLVEAENARPTA